MWQWIRSFLLDGENLRREIERTCAQSDKLLVPIKERLAIVDELIADDQAQIERLLDLYQHDKAQAVIKDALLERLTRLKETTASLEKERISLLAQLETAQVSQDQLKEVETIAAKMREAVEMASEDIQAQRYVVDRLETEVRLGVENGERVAYARCIFGQKAMVLSANTKAEIDRPYGSR